MAKTSRTETGLLVLEYDGSPRSGKGTSAENVIEKTPSAEIVETGASYRAVTFRLLEAGVIEPGMSEKVVAEQIKGWQGEDIAQLAWEREAILRDVGKGALYDGDVPGLVGKVSPHQQIREGVKARFKKELEILVGSENTTIAVCDGRGLARAARGVSGLEIVQRVFFTCSDGAAADRELARYIAKEAEAGRGVSDEEQEEYRRRKKAELGERRHDDEIRGLDPVEQEKNALEYWHNQKIIDNTIATLVRRNMMSSKHANESVLGRNSNRYSRIGAGTIAYAQGVGEARQIHYDTNTRNLNEMLDDTLGMFHEALDARARGLVA